MKPVGSSHWLNISDIYHCIHEVFRLAILKGVRT